MRTTFVTKTSVFLTPVTNVTAKYITFLYRTHILEVTENPVTNGYWLQNIV